MRKRGGGVMKKERRWGEEETVCAGVDGIQKRKHAVVPITD